MKQDEYTMACAQRLMRKGFADVTVITDEAVAAHHPEGWYVIFRCIPTGWSRVGEMEVEETVALVRHYGADSGAILTNGRFTRGARITARHAGNISLFDRFDAHLDWIDRTEDYDALL